MKSGKITLCKAASMLQLLSMAICVMFFVSCEKHYEGGKDVDDTPYLTFTAITEQTLTVKLKNNYRLSETLQYSVGYGKWKSLIANTAITFGGENGTLRLRGKSAEGLATSYIEYAHIAFDNSDVMVACSGDIRTLVDYEKYSTADTQNARFCYMFYGCAQLISAPELSATTLATQCYSHMFLNCTNLEVAPALPATIVTDLCYMSMFSNCFNLKAAPALPATTLGRQCYAYMFSACKSLKVAPELPATTLEYECYDNMFVDCTNLEVAPAVLPATTLAEGCYYCMFCDCKNLANAPKLPAKTLVRSCYRYIFFGCKKLDSITMLATDISASSCLTEWVSGVASTGTFTKAAEMTSLQTGVNGIPEGWTVVDYEDPAN